jgi:2-polyprenyl-3-methyl-5-hydroxy-6-metoxy-1,4-benzoquinol methylase|tara:strand:+ start:9594 stop:11255 length:1662 start_codon:yes stop_codon:yes gene_type:complete
MDGLAETIKAAVDHHNAGRLETASGIYQEILHHHPGQPDALHLLGLIAAQIGHHDDALGLFDQAIDSDPQVPLFHKNKAIVLEAMGDWAEAISEYQQSLRLGPNDIETLEQLESLIGQVERQAHIAAQSRSLVIDGIEFLPLTSHGNGAAIISRSVDQRYFIKIEVSHDPDKANTLEQEKEIMEYLNGQGCVTCPKFHRYGTIPIDRLTASLNDQQKTIVLNSGQDSLPYIIQDYIEEIGWAPVPDMVIALLEQKSLGVYHGDLRPDNLGFDDSTGICYFVDYDQAEYLDDATRDLNNIDFLHWCDRRAREKYRKFGFKSFLNYFQGIELESHVLPLFENTAFNIGRTTVFKRQETTLAECGIYHTLQTSSLFSKGERDLDARQPLLDGIVFSPDERVLDVGCNAGLLSIYLSDRGCRVRGIDIDRSIIYAARLIGHILRKEIEFECLDLDLEEIGSDYDTVMLFSVIHHTRNLEANALNISQRCHRIVIECRLEEHGAKPDDGTWIETSVWNCAGVGELVARLEGLFPGFTLKRNHGQVDRSRYILEFTDGN